MPLRFWTDHIKRAPDARVIIKFKLSMLALREIIHLILQGEAVAGRRRGFGRLQHVLSGLLQPSSSLRR